MALSWGSRSRSPIHRVCRQVPAAEHEGEPPRKRRRLSARLNAENAINGIAPLALGSVSSDREPLRPSNSDPTAIKAKAHKKNPWKTEEDALLVKLKSESLNYSEIALRIPGRSAKQCRERWSSTLNPQLNRADFTEEEDQMICDMVAKEGQRWAKLEKAFDSKRAANTIKNRFNNRLKDSPMFHAALGRLVPQPPVPLTDDPEEPPAPVVSHVETPVIAAQVPRKSAFAQAAAAKREQENEKLLHSLVSSAERNENNKRFLAALQNLMNRFPNLFNASIENMTLSVDEMMRRQQDRGMFHHHLRRLVAEFKPMLDLQAAPTQLITAVAESQLRAQDETDPVAASRSEPNEKDENVALERAQPFEPTPQIEALLPRLYSTEELPPPNGNEAALFASPIAKPSGRRIHLRFLPRARPGPSENESEPQIDQRQVPPEPFEDSSLPPSPPPPRSKPQFTASRIPANERESTKSASHVEKTVKRLPSKTMARTPRPLIGQLPTGLKTPLEPPPFPEISKTPKQGSKRHSPSPQSDSLASVSSLSSPEQTPHPSRSGSNASAPSSVSSVAGGPSLSLGSASVGSTPGNSSGSGNFLSPGPIRSKRRRSSVGVAHSAAPPLPSPVAAPAPHQSPLPSPSASFSAMEQFQLNDFDFVGALEFDSNPFEDHSLFNPSQQAPSFGTLPTASETHILPPIAQRADVEHGIPSAQTSEVPPFSWEGDEDALMQDAEFPYPFVQHDSDS